MNGQLRVAAPPRALVVFPGALGDFLLLAPALAALHAGGARVELSVRRTLGELARAIVPGPLGPPADGAAMATLFSGALDASLAAWLRGAARLDVWFEAADRLDEHARALAIGAARRHRVERGDDGPHASVAYAAALAVAPCAPRVAPAWLAEARRRPRARGLVIHPGAGAAAKRWSTGGFVRVADEWRRRGGEPIVLLGPAEEREHAEWAATGHEVVAALGLRDAAALLASAPLYLGNDSGVSHLAGLVGGRGVVLFTATRPARWRPLGGALRAWTCAGLGDTEVCARVLAELERAGRLDTPTPRH